MHPRTTHPRNASFRHALSFATLIALVTLLATACGLGGSSPEPTATPQPPTEVPATATPTPTPTATPEPTPTPEPPPQLTAGDAITIGGAVRTRTGPDSTAEQAALLGDLQPLDIVQRVQGENWLAGEQDWMTYTPPWASEWYQIADGSYIYGAFVFMLQEGDTSPLTPAPDGAEKWIDIDLTSQVARAMVGEEAVFTARISSGEPSFETPKGSFAIEPDGRLAVERMSATQAGYDPEETEYEVERVLFTQYFDRSGNALHLNYWRPPEVFGNTPTSHGCIGMELYAAQYFWLFAEPGTRVEIHD